jgi:hypothetical protein
LARETGGNYVNLGESCQLSNVWLDGDSKPPPQHCRSARIDLADHLRPVAGSGETDLEAADSREQPKSR